MPAAKKRKWLGGYVRAGKNGITFVIERWINGVHFHVSTKCKTERAANKEFERFEMDPAGYRKGRTRRTAGLALTPELVAEYLEWMDSRGLDGGYVRQHEMHLGALLEAIPEHDLSRMTYAELRDVLAGIGDPNKKAATAARRKAVKAFAAYLRRERGLLTRQNDPTLDLTINYAPPEKNRRRKAMPLGRVERAIPLMDPDVADVAIALAGTGLHIRELRRAHRGTGGLQPLAEWQRGTTVLANLSVMHKSKRMHAVAITSQTTLDALNRIFARTEFPTRGRISKHDAKVTKRLGEKFSMGWLRHSVATWLAENRVSIEQIAEQLGHADTRQARQTYIDLGLAAHPVPIPHLRVVKS